jgi:adenylate cyclase class IV
MPPTRADVANPGKNLELKARVTPHQLDQVRQRLAARGLALAAACQTDTYYTVPRGRLKLREIIPASGEPTCELIAYDRPDVANTRWSAYYRVALSPAQGLALRDALAQTLPVRVVVAKQREVARWRHTRVHLDQVDGLGAFVELETVMESEKWPDAEADAEIAEAAELCGLTSATTIVAGSYSDLLLHLQSSGEIETGARMIAGGKKQE